MYNMDIKRRYMEELKKKLESIVPTLDKRELDSRFPQIAEFLMKNYGIESHGKTYLINEIEFYYYDPLYDDFRVGSRKCRITYERTASAGCWFFHDYGVDLTFNSNKEKGYGGGILIRSIEDPSKPEPFITGPVRCINELWQDAVYAFRTTAPNPRIVRINERFVEFNEPDTRVTVDKYDKYQSKWRFTVKGKDVSKRKNKVL